MSVSISYSDDAHSSFSPLLTKKQVRFVEGDLVVSSTSCDDEEGFSSSASSVGSLSPPAKPFRPLLKRRSRRRKTGGDESPPEVSPDVLAAQFRWARKSKDYTLMASVLDKLQSEPDCDGPIHQKLSSHVLDEALLFSMLSRDLKLTHMLLDAGASIGGADRIYNEMRGDLSCCDCGVHPGMLLITLVRQSSYRMIEIALEELSVESFICDGDTRRMWWGIGYSFQGLTTVKTPVLKSLVMKTTPLSAAIVNNDLHTVEMLIGRGADISAHDCLAFTEAAKLGDDKKNRILGFLFQRITQLPSFGNDPRITALFENAAAAAIRSAAENGDAEKLKFVIQFIEAEQEWVLGTQRKNRKKPSSIFKERKVLGETSQGRPLYEPANNHSSLSSTSSWTSSSSGGSSTLSNGSLNVTSMEKYQARRQSLQVMKPLIDHEAVHSRNKQRTAASARSTSGDFVERALSIAINKLIEDGADPQHANRAGLSRALEGLAMLDSRTIRERREDLFNVFLATLEQSGRTAEKSALALLDCGLDEFLVENVTASSLSSPYDDISMPVMSPLSSPSSSPRTLNSGSLQESKKKKNGKKRNKGGKGGRARLAWGKLKSGLAKSLGGSGTSLSMHSSKRTMARRASSEEKMKALTLACESGHIVVLERLLARIDTGSMEIVAPRLLCVAAQNDNVSLISIILPYLGADNQDALISAFQIAMEHQSMAFAESLLEEGANPEKAVFVDILCSCAGNESFREENCDMMCQLMSDQGVALDLEDVAEIVQSITTSKTPNLYVFASVLDMDESFRTAVKTEHLINVVKTSALNTSNPEHPELMMILLKCLEASDLFDEAISEAYDEAVAQSPVHPGVLALLMEHSGHHDQEETWV